ncbi:MAG: hypothetical protein EDR02_18575 [Actinobacteria bacterium]|nr:MAG: hypothetical protein EDR02_18575 [Actinomycetota bacterium]
MLMARRFGHTWWGRAWIEALEHRASLDPNRLPRGRSYARQGQVLSLEAEPGLIRAAVQGRRARPYRVEVRFRTFGDDEWERVLDVIVAEAARAAALLDGELPTDLVNGAAGAGVELLPHAGELQPRCSCPDWADPCKHSAAVCYLVADELDADPFVLLRLRGRDREEVLAAVRRRRAGAPGAAGEPPAADPPATAIDEADRGIRASRAWSRPTAALPEVPHPRPAPGRVAVWPSDPPAEAPFDAAGLCTLVADAAERAWAAIADGASLGLGLSDGEDLTRWAASMPDRASLAGLAERAGTTLTALERRARAWQVAGPAGLTVLDEKPWRAVPLHQAGSRLGTRRRAC